MRIVRIVVGSFATHDHQAQHPETLAWQTARICEQIMPTDRDKAKRWRPRFGLRALMWFVLLIAAALAAGRVVWWRARPYAAYTEIHPNGAIASFEDTQDRLRLAAKMDRVGLQPCRTCPANRTASHTLLGLRARLPTAQPSAGSSHVEL